MNIYQQYIVYQLIDPRSNTPYYVGFSSTLTRPLDHLGETQQWLSGKKLPHPNYFKMSKIRDILNEGYEFKYEIIFSSDDPDAAYAKEVEMIAFYGRRDIKTGILTNMNAGGRGCLNPSEEVRDRIRKGNSGTLVERWGEERAAVHIEKMKSIPKEVYSEMGKKGAQHIVNNGWSTETILKRVETRKNNGGFSTDMSACHTADAIEKRTATRKERGVNYNTSGCYTTDALFKREKTKTLRVIQKIQDHYSLPFTIELFWQARKDRVTYMKEATLSKYFTAEDIRQLPYDGPSAT